MTHPYHAHRDVVTRTAKTRRFRTLWPDPAEAEQEAAYLFVQAVHEYDPARGSLARFYRHHARRAAQTALRQRFRHPDPTDLDNTPVPDRRHFDLFAFLGELSADARAAARIALDEADGCGGNPQRSRCRAMRALKALGWPAWRVDRAFAEIRGALT